MSSCGNQRSHHLQGYIEGEFVHVASPLGGHLGRELWPIALFAIAVLWIGIRRYRRTLD